MNYNKTKIVDRIKKINSTPYKNLFAVGDIILNKRDKIIRRVKEIIPDTLDNPSHYLLVDVINPLKNPKYLKYESTKPVKAIDCYYELIDEQTANILYGSKR